MNRPQYTKEQISEILEEHCQGKSAVELCRKYEISDTTFYKWRMAAGLGATRQKNVMAELREENLQLRILIAEQSLRIEQLEQQFDAQP